MNNFYVYEWIRLDNNEPFYVGKGKGDRAYSLKDRNKHFHNIVNKVGLENCAVVILHNNLTNDEACEIECWYIHQYKYLGPYNITNQTDGGEGVAGYKWTGEQKQKFSGEKNPMYGRTGEKNPMWGKGELISGEKTGCMVEQERIIRCGVRAKLLFLLSQMVPKKNLEQLKMLHYILVVLDQIVPLQKEFKAC